MPNHITPDESLTLRIWLLGGFRVSIGLSSIPEMAWKLHKAKSLVKLLALASSHRQHREQVLELLWPDLEPEAALNNLHHTLHTIRRIFEPQLPPHQPSTYLRLQEGILLLCPAAPLWVDVEAFRTAGIAARTSKDSNDYRAALALYAGDLLPEDRYEDWAIRPREELHQLYLALLTELARLHESRHEYPSAITAFQQIVVSEPTLEEAHRDLMRLHALIGQRYQALRQYQQLRDVLQRELDVAPATSTQRLYEDIRTGHYPPGQTASSESLNLTGLKSEGSGTPTLPTEMPGVTAIPTQSTNLPNLLTSFIGREKELSEVSHLLATCRLLTLIGAGGCGKTRLALQVAASHLVEYPDGVWLVELAALTDPELVLQVVGNALGVREEANRPLLETLTDFLRSRHLLIVLDNCEHLLDSCARLAESLLWQCPQLHILATSRQALGLSSEAIWRVPSLATPDPEHLPDFERLPKYDAVHLFLDRAAASRPGFVLTTENAPAVVRICHRLDGIPLALELAAVRVKVLAAEQIANRLDNALALLTKGNQSGLPRQQTLRATLDWSHTLLNESEQALFRRLAIFAGGWTLEAAEEVGADEYIAPGDVLDLLAELVDKSLVVTEEQGAQVRYRLLETVRQYSMEKLQAVGELTPLHRRHATWCLKLAETEPRSGERMNWLEQLETEHDNLRAMLQWSLESGEVVYGLRLAGALWRFWDVHGHLSEGRRWLDELLASKGHAPAPVRAKALRCAGLLALNQSDYERARTLLEESLALYRELGDQKGVAWVLNNIGNVALDQGDYDRAVSLYKESLAYYRELGDKDGISRTLNNLAIVAAYQEDYDQSLSLFEESLVVHRELGYKDGIAQLLTNLGELTLRQGNYERAVGYYQEGLAMHWELGYKNGIAYCMEGLAAVTAALGHPIQAARLWGAAQKLRETIGTSLSSADFADYERRVVAARAQTDEKEFARAWEKGRITPLEQIIRDTLAQVRATPAITAIPAPPMSAKPPALLSRREREVVLLIAAGRTNREIASELAISQRTVDTHVSNILAKLELSSRAQIVTWAMEQQLVATTTT
jgi:predicted ATPase/DNA-binding SARP family transcriptional activator/DNA-binding CsgD family transcriptional regulator